MRLHKRPCMVLLGVKTGNLSKIASPDGRGTGSGSDRRNAAAATSIKQFLDAATDTSIVSVHVIGQVRNAAAIARAVGFPVVGYSVIVENGTARHAIKCHGDAQAEAKRGQIAVTRDDLARLPQLLGEFDTAEAAETTKQGIPQVRLTKRMQSICYELYAEVKPKAKQLVFKPMLKRRDRGDVPS